jgi:hypothetical protein
MPMLHVAEINLVTGIQSARPDLPCTCRALELAIILLVSVMRSLYLTTIDTYICYLGSPRLACMSLIVVIDAMTLLTDLNRAQPLLL